MKIGQYVIIDPTATVADDCDVDDYVSIREGAVVGKGVVIKCRATIGMNCTVGDNCFIGAHAILLNGKGAAHSDPAHLGDRVFLGACVCVLPGVKICSEATVGSGSVVTKDITEPGVYVGNPCRKI